METGAEAQQEEVAGTRTCSTSEEVEFEFELPVVDLSLLDGGATSFEDRENAVKQMKHFFHTIGFVYLINHDISEELIQQAQMKALAFFEQSQDAKLQCLSRDRAKRGYSPLLTENFACLAGNKAPNDLVEKFRIGPLLHSSNDDEYYTSKEGRSHFFPNTWPPEQQDGVLNGFENTMKHYYEAMESLVGRLISVFEFALELDQGYFSENMKKHTSILSLNYYPPLQGLNVCKGQRRVAAHTDVSLFTVVAPGGPGPAGLEVDLGGGGGGARGEGESRWAAVPPLPGALVLNLGDFFAHLTAPPPRRPGEGGRRSGETGGGWRSTSHRVALPRAGAGARVSLAYFVGPNYDCPATRLHRLRHHQNNQKQLQKHQYLAHQVLAVKQSTQALGRGGCCQEGIINSDINKENLISGGQQLHPQEEEGEEKVVIQNNDEASSSGGGVAIIKTRGGGKSGGLQQEQQEQQEYSTVEQEEQQSYFNMFCHEETTYSAWRKKRVQAAMKKFKGRW